MDSATYYRVSSRSQTLDMQRHAVEREAKARGDRIPLVYHEKKSAKTMDRPELLRLRSDIRAGKVRKLYVYRLDRLSRSGIRDTFEIVEEARAAGCVLVSVTEGWFDLTSPVADMILACMAWASQMERLAINERIAGARERIEAEGGRWGRLPRLDEKGEDRVLRLRDQEGRTLRQIAIALKVPLSSVARAEKRARKRAAAVPKSSPRKRRAA